MGNPHLLSLLWGQDSFAQCVVKPHYFDRLVTTDFQARAKHLHSCFDKPAFFHHTAGSDAYLNSISASDSRQGLRISLAVSNIRILTSFSLSLLQILRR